MNFDPVARWYVWLEHLSFGPLLWRRRVAFAGKLDEAKAILLAGDGDGRFLAYLLNKNSAARIVSVEASAAMVEAQKQRAAGQADRVVWVATDVRQADLPVATMDGIVTHFFLDCFAEHEIDRVVERLSRAAKPGALWLVSEFQAPAHSWWRRAVVRVLYLFFRLTCGLRTRALPDYRSALRRAGWHLEKAQESCGGLLVSEGWRRAQGEDKTP